MKLEPGKTDPRADRHALKISPTVLVLGADGKERARFEGEGAETVQRLKSQLQALVRLPQ